MTVAPCTVASSQTVAAALQLLRAHRIHHLPVVDGARLVGVVTAHDLQLVAAGRAPAIDEPEPTVRDAMTTEVLAVAEDTGLDEVVSRMADGHCDSAVAMKHGAVTGIFTTVDALRALNDVLTRAAG